MQITKDTNPKDIEGTKKAPTWVIPATALLHLGMAMRNGQLKYGAYNWQEKKVQASVYSDAMIRHWMAWLSGERSDPVSGCHHLAHLMACCAIMIDAEETGNMIDNRPMNARVPELIRELQQHIEKEKRCSYCGLPESAGGGAINEVAGHWQTHCCGQVVAGCCEGSFGDATAG